MHKHTPPPPHTQTQTNMLNLLLFYFSKKVSICVLTHYYGWQQIVLKQIHSEVGYFSKDEDDIWSTSHAAQQPSFILLESVFVIRVFTFFRRHGRWTDTTKVTRSQHWSDILQIQIVIPQGSFSIQSLYWLVVWLLHPLFCIYEKGKKVVLECRTDQCYALLSSSLSLSFNCF